MPLPESIEAYAARVLAAQESTGGHLPLPADGLTTWPSFPVEGDLRARTLEPLVDAESPRLGENPGTCWCQDAAAGAGWRVLWSDDHWQIKAAPSSGAPVLLILEPRAHLDLADLPRERAAEFGILTVLLTAAIEALPSVGRCHVARWGDGGAHGHIWFIARPARMPQLRGTFMALWDDIIPPIPDEVRAANDRAVVQRVAAAYGGVVHG